MRLLDILASLGLSLVRRSKCFQEWRPRPPMIQSASSQLNEYLGDSAELMLRLHCARREQKLRVRFNDGVANAMLPMMMRRVRYFQYE